MSIVLIPSIGASPRFEAVLRAAEYSQAHAVYVIENQSRDGDRHSPSAWSVWNEANVRSFFITAEGFSLYDVWNAGIRYARLPDWGTMRHPVCVILNDDVEITSKAIDYAIEALEQNAEYAVIGFNYFDHAADPVTPSKLVEVHGSYRHHGVGGFAFACRADLCSVDPQFEWWGGDDDMFFDAKKQGYKLGILQGAPVAHPEPETSARLFPELLAAKDRDRQRLRAKWNESW